MLSLSFSVVIFSVGSDDFSDGVMAAVLKVPPRRLTKITTRMVFRMVFCMVLFMIFLPP